MKCDMFLTDTEYEEGSSERYLTVSFEKCLILSFLLAVKAVTDFTDTHIFE